VNHRWKAVTSGSEASRVLARAAAALGLIGAGLVLFPSSASAGAPVATTLYTGSGSQPAGIVFDRNSDVIFAVGGAILELAWDSTTGRYATTPTTVASLSGVDGLAIDPSGDLFAADYGNGDVYELAWNGTQFGAPEDLASVGSGLVDVAVNPANDDLLLTPSGDGEVDEMVWNASTDSYGAPTALLTGLDNPAGLFVGQHDDLFVTEYQGGAIVEYPWNTSTASYGAQVSVASSLGYENPNFVVQDSDGNLFFDETQNGSVDEIPWSGSSFGSPETVYGPLTQLSNVQVDVMTALVSFDRRQAPTSNGIGAFAEAVDARMDALQKRRDRYRRRAEAMRGAAMAAMASVTVSIRAKVQSLSVKRNLDMARHLLSGKEGTEERIDILAFAGAGGDQLREILSNGFVQLQQITLTVTVDLQIEEVAQARQ